MNATATARWGRLRRGCSCSGGRQRGLQALGASDQDFPDQVRRQGDEARLRRDSVKAAEDVADAAPAQGQCVQLVCGPQQVRSRVISHKPLQGRLAQQGQAGQTQLLRLLQHLEAQLAHVPYGGQGVHVEVVDQDIKGGQRDVA